MKLGKEEVQKIVLGVLLAGGGIYAYFEFLLGPLKQSRDGAIKAAATMEPKIKEAKAQISRVKDLEAKAPVAHATLKQIEQMIPEGSPVAWFPTLTADLFKKSGVEKAATRMSSDVPDKSLTGYRRIAWTVEIPKSDFASLGAAIASFENSEPLVQLDGVSIEYLREEPDLQRTTLTVSNVVKQ
jgi:hypothetical protein